MILGESLPFIKDYVFALNDALRQSTSQKQLTRLQIYWLSFIILGILVTNSVCWKQIERSSVGKYSASSISWMFKHARINWDSLLYASTLKIIEYYNISAGILIIDDTDIERSKNTTTIAKVHKIRDKKHGGYFSGQNLVFLVFVSNEVTIPVGFEFYEPDPELKKWKKEDTRLKENKIPKKDRPKEPAKNPDYPGKKAIAIALLEKFVKSHSNLKIKGVVADSFYGNESFLREASRVTNQNQVISQIRRNQLIMVEGKYIETQKYFAAQEATVQKIQLRGKDKTITYCTGKYKVKSHDKKYTVIALKYDDEKDYRYIIANDMTWRIDDIIKTFAIRWLVEVFIQDWKSYEGWNKKAMQPGFKGAGRSVTLSLLCDHVLFFHEDQKDLFRKDCPAATVGTLRNKVLMESLSQFIGDIINSDNPKKSFEKLNQSISEIFNLKSSNKHMRNIGYNIN